MDTRTANIDITPLLNEIKTYMPETYKSIQDRERGVTVQEERGPVVMVPAYGKAVFALVRKGLRGEPNCFWAMERGRVVGTPFDNCDVTRETAYYMVHFGCAHVCMFAPVPEASHGTH